MRFSERLGLKPIKVNIQIDSIDVELKNSLWNTLDTYIFAFFYEPIEYDGYAQKLLVDLWSGYFKKPLDERPNKWISIRDALRTYYFKAPWYEVYDFLEFIANHYPLEIRSQQFKSACNVVFERELSAYRFIENQITKITEQVEMAEIESALTVPYKGARQHVAKALDLFSNKKLLIIEIR